MWLRLVPDSWVQEIHHAQFQIPLFKEMFSAKFGPSRSLLRS
jgi:hypothetical protein